jgi:hypothetical protein
MEREKAILQTKLKSIEQIHKEEMYTTNNLDKSYQNKRKNCKSHIDRFYFEIWRKEIKIKRTKLR